MPARMGNLRLVEQVDRAVFDAYRKGKKVGIVLYRDFVDGKKRLHRGRRARQFTRKFYATRAHFARRFPDVIRSQQPPHVVRWLGLA